MTIFGASVPNHSSPPKEA